MNHHLLLHLSRSYLRIKQRGAIWTESFYGGWYSRYHKEAHKVFLLRFDPSVQAKIKLLAGERQDPVDIPAHAAIALLHPTI